MWDTKLPETDEEGKFEVHRSKGRLVFKDGSTKILQGVREVFEINDGPRNEDAPPEGKIILIGKNVAGIDFVRSFGQVLERACG